MPPPPQKLLSLTSFISSHSSPCPHPSNTKIIKYLQTYYKATSNLITEVQRVMNGIEAAGNSKNLSHFTLEGTFWKDALNASMGILKSLNLTSNYITSFLCISFQNSPIIAVPPQDVCYKNTFSCSVTHLLLFLISLTSMGVNGVLEPRHL